MLEIKESKKEIAPVDRAKQILVEAKHEKKGSMRAYEVYKQRLRAIKLSNLEYERAIRDLASILKV
jgi:uncharacterized membrane protein